MVEFCSLLIRLDVVQSKTLQVIRSIYIHISSNSTHAVPRTDEKVVLISRRPCYTRDTVCWRGLEFDFYTVTVLGTVRVSLPSKPAFSIGHNQKRRWWRRSKVVSHLHDSTASRVIVISKRFPLCIPALNWEGLYVRRGAFTFGNLRSSRSYDTQRQQKAYFASQIRHSPRMYSFA